VRCVDPIPECQGFGLKRSRAGEATYLHNFVGFNDTDPFPTDDPWKWPLQRYMWWDYDVHPGDSVKYQVIPVTGPAGSLQLMSDLASDWTDELTITSDFAPHVSAYFNKGVIAAQWVSRELDTERESAGRLEGRHHQGRRPAAGRPFSTAESRGPQGHR
jgi:hypothetical protein